MSFNSPDAREWSSDTDSRLGSGRSVTLLDAFKAEWVRCSSAYCSWSLTYCSRKRFKCFRAFSSSSVWYKISLNTCNSLLQHTSYMLQHTGLWETSWCWQLFSVRNSSFTMQLGHEHIYHYYNLITTIYLWFYHIQIELGFPSWHLIICQNTGN